MRGFRAVSLLQQHGQESSEPVEVDFLQNLVDYSKVLKK